MLYKHCENFYALRLCHVSRYREFFSVKLKNVKFFKIPKENYENSSVKKRKKYIIRVKSRLKIQCVKLIELKLLV